MLYFGATPQKDDLKGRSKNWGLPVALVLGSKHVTRQATTRSRDLPPSETNFLSFLRASSFRVGPKVMRVSRLSF